MSETDSAAEPSRDPADPADSAGADEKAGESTDKTEHEDPGSWLKDDSRARDTATFGPLLEQAFNELLGKSGRPTGGVRSNVLIAGEVHIAGDLLGGDKHAGSSGSAFAGEVIAGEVGTDVLKQIERSYVPPPAYRRLLERLREHRILLLRAPSGWGRTATGLHIL